MAGVHGKRNVQCESPGLGIDCQQQRVLQQLANVTQTGRIPLHTACYHIQRFLQGTVLYIRMCAAAASDTVEAPRQLHYCRGQHSHKPHLQATPPSHTSKLHRQATPPGHAFRPHFQAPLPGPTSRPHLQATPPSHTSKHTPEATQSKNACTVSHYIPTLIHVGPACLQQLSLRVLHPKPVTYL